jgi:hypothetical protein
MFNNLKDSQTSLKQRLALPQVYSLQDRLDDQNIFKSPVYQDNSSRDMSN